jgi:hypothetical protein
MMTLSQMVLKVFAPCDISEIAPRRLHTRYELRRNPEYFIL